jgi:glycosyltransferase involved in cell wall biosynthesis
MSSPINSNTNQNLKRRTLTVFVPNYNHGYLIPRCLDSILSQSRLPDEILICDDGSTDNSMEVVKIYEEKWPMIRVIRNEPNLGILFTLRRLAQEAVGELVVGCAADDELCQGFVAHVMAVAETKTHLGMYLGRTKFRFPSTDGGSPKDKELAFGLSGEVSPKDLQKVPSWLEPHLPNGISISAVLNRQYWLEFLPASLQLGPLSDVFERLDIAAKYGFYVVDVPGHIFYQTEGGYSRTYTSEWALDSIKRLSVMANLVSSTPFEVHFSPRLRKTLGTIWATQSMWVLDRYVAKPFHDATSQIYLTFDKLPMSGKTCAKLIGKVLGLARNLQLWWLKKCLLRHFRSVLKVQEIASARCSQSAG